MKHTVISTYRVLRRAFKRWLLRQHGRSLMRRYIGAADDIAGGDHNYAERVAPSIKKYRRRAMATVRLSKSI